MSVCLFQNGDLFLQKPLHIVEYYSYRQWNINYFVSAKVELCRAK